MASFKVLLLLWLIVCVLAILLMCRDGRAMTLPATVPKSELHAARDRYLLTPSARTHRLAACDSSTGSITAPATGPRSLS